MSAKRKGALWGLLKEATTPQKSYIHYKVEELEAELNELGVDIEASLAMTSYEQEEKPPPEPPKAKKPKKSKKQKASPPQLTEKAPAPRYPAVPQPDYGMPRQELTIRPQAEAAEDILRVDELGRQWFQEEVRKPAYPKPRGRRVLKYVETGTRKETVHNGEYVETFEVAGAEPGRPAEVKITMPSYQVGIYRDPRFPFKIHCYNDKEGFDLYDVQDFYGGSELVPATVKRVYIENDLCYDIRSVVRAISDEHRHLQLTGRAR